MKQLITSLTFLLACSGLWAQSGYDIQIDIQGFEESEAYLAYYLGNKQYIKDTVASENGRLRFAGEEPLDGGIYLVVLPPSNRYMEVIVDKDQHFQLKTDTSDFVKSMKVTGSADNQLFYQDMRFLAKNRTQAEQINAEIQGLEDGSPKKAELQAQLTQIDKDVKAYRIALIEDHPDMLYGKLLKAMIDPVIPEDIQEDQAAAFYYYRSKFLDNVDFSDDRLLRTPVMYNKVNTYLENLTVKQPDSINKSVDIILERAKAHPDVFQYFTVNTLNKYAKSKIMGMDAVYVHIVEQVYMQGDAWWADSAQVATLTERAMALSPTILGRTAPDFRVQDIQGNFTQLHGVKEKYTILYFWSYDCGHCQKATPKLVEVFDEFKDKDVALFSVSINGDIEVWKEKVKEYGLEDAINVQDHARRSGFDALYDIRSTPRVFILDEEKTIIAKQIGVEQIREVLNHAMGIETEEEVKDE